MTPFQIALEKAQAGEFKTPVVSTSEGQIDYFGYQLAVHKYNLSLMSKGIMSRGIKLKDLKWYYGLKGRTVTDCLSQFIQIMEEYKVKLKSQ
jgi:hypothetical protein